MELTRDADKIICIIYKYFLQKRNEGYSKSESKSFDADFLQKSNELMSWNPQDIMDTLLEIGRKGLVRIYVDGGFMLTDSGIIYMENRFKNGFLEVVDFISKFIP